jgi:SsrA-binding protein
MARKVKKNKDHVLISNNRAFYDYAISEDFLAGIMLTGSEVKSLRKGHANLRGAFITAKIDGGKYYVYLHNFMINPYQGHDDNTNVRRKRILLLNPREIEQIHTKSNAKGSNIIPLAVELHHNLIKVKIALAIGKKKYDKRQALKDKAIRRDLSQDKSIKI